jgi:hypothetical protein
MGYPASFQAWAPAECFGLVDIGVHVPKRIDDDAYLGFVGPYEVG